MPSCTSEIQTQIENLFPDEERFYDDAAEFYLESHGFILNRDFSFQAPKKYKKWEDLSSDEQTCIIYLDDEWGFGGVLFGLEGD